MEEGRDPFRDVPPARIEAADVISRRIALHMVHGRWPLAASLIIHRYGRLEPGERIVLVATASAHRQAALEACAFLIDWLKTQAPFWKLEETPDGAEWVEARESDDAAAARWRGKRGVGE